MILDIILHIIERVPQVQPRDLDILQRAINREVNRQLNSVELTRSEQHLVGYLLEGLVVGRAHLGYRLVTGVVG